MAAIVDICWTAAATIVSSVPQPVGQVRAARWLGPRLPHPPTLHREVDLPGGVQLVVDVRDRLQRELLLTGRWEPEMTAFIAERLPPRGTFFDVGANVGLASFSVGSACADKDVATHAFEPSPANVMSFKANLESNPSLRITLTQAAVGAAAGRATLVQGSEGSHHFVSSSRSATDVVVDMVTLDEYAEEHGCGTIDVMKIDVEGFELEVLRGAHSLFRRRAVRVVIAEVIDSHLRRAGTSAPELVQAFMSYGYYPMPLASRSGRARQLRKQSPLPFDGDVVFLPVTPDPAA